MLRKDAKLKPLRPQGPLTPRPNVFGAEDDDGDEHEIQSVEAKLNLDDRTLISIPDASDPELTAPSRETGVLASRLEAVRAKAVAHAQAAQWSWAIRCFREALSLLNKPVQDPEALSDPVPTFKAKLHEQIAQIYLILTEELGEQARAREAGTTDARISAASLHGVDQHDSHELYDSYCFEALRESELAVASDPAFPWGHFTLARARILCGHGHLAQQAIDEAQHRLRQDSNASSEDFQMVELERQRITTALSKQMSAHFQQIVELQTALEAMPITSEASSSHQELGTALSDARLRLEGSLRSIALNCPDTANCKSSVCQEWRRRDKTAMPKRPESEFSLQHQPTPGDIMDLIRARVCGHPQTLASQTDKDDEGDQDEGEDEEIDAEDDYKDFRRSRRTQEQSNSPFGTERDLEKYDFEYYEDPGENTDLTRKRPRSP